MIIIYQSCAPCSATRSDPWWLRTFAHSYRHKLKKPTSRPVDFIPPLLQGHWGWSGVEVENVACCTTPVKPTCHQATSKEAIEFIASLKKIDGKRWFDNGLTKSMKEHSAQSNAKHSLVAEPSIYRTGTRVRSSKSILCAVLDSTVMRQQIPLPCVLFCMRTDREAVSRTSSHECKTTCVNTVLYFVLHATEKTWFHSRVVITRQSLNKRSSLPALSSMKGRKTGCASASRESVCGIVPERFPCGDAAQYEIWNHDP